jgi:hypothetical protein
MRDRLSCVSDVGKLGLAIVSAFIGALIGYLVRRKEHLREQRIDAYRQLLAAFVAAARSGANLVSVHTQTGYPHEINRKTTPKEQADAMTQAHAEAFRIAADDRAKFELSAAGAEMVASEDIWKNIDDLRTVLDSALYNGLPWRHAQNYPTMGVNPVDIEPLALKLAGNFAGRAARELWKRSVPSVKAREAWGFREVDDADVNVDVP